MKPLKSSLIVPHSYLQYKSATQEQLNSNSKSLVHKNSLIIINQKQIAMSVLIGEKEYFPGVGQIKFEGPESDNPLAFRWYDENRIVAGKTMKDYLKFSCAYWHSFCIRRCRSFWRTYFHSSMECNKADAVERAKDKMDAAFEFMTKMGMEYYCFHDLDVVDYTPMMWQSMKDDCRQWWSMQKKSRHKPVLNYYGEQQMYSHIAVI